MKLNKGVIAVSGKGGVGKTSISALLVKKLSQMGNVLAVDADPDSNLSLALGVNVKKTLGDVRESILHAPLGQKLKMTKEEFAKLAFHESVEEYDNFDLVVMGRPEESGCYCKVNSIIREVIDFRALTYEFSVIDCHAGLEHLSRRTTRGVDIMVVVTDHTKNGMLTAKRVVELSKELSIDFGKILIVANKISSSTRSIVDKAAKEAGLNIDVYIPFDDKVSNLNLFGKPVVDLSSSSPVLTAVDSLYDEIVSDNI